MELVRFQEDPLNTNLSEPEEPEESTELEPTELLTAPLVEPMEPHWMDRANPIIWSVAGVLLVVLGIYQVL
jgi:hypothetical protein